MSVEIFLSYAKPNRDLVGQVANVIREKLSKEPGLSGCDVWFDERLEPGAEWDELIREKLETADIFLFLITDASTRASYMWYPEFHRAYERYCAGAGRVRLIPLWYSNVQVPAIAHGIIRSLNRIPIDIHEILQDDWFSQVAIGVQKAVKGILSQTRAPGRNVVDIIQTVKRLSLGVRTGLDLEQREFIGGVQAKKIESTLNQINWALSLPGQQRQETLSRVSLEIGRYRVAVKTVMPEVAVLFGRLREHIDELDVESAKERPYSISTFIADPDALPLSNDVIHAANDRLVATSEQLDALSSEAHTAEANLEAGAAKYTKEVGLAHVRIGNSLLTESPPNLPALEAQMNALTETTLGYKRTLEIVDLQPNSEKIRQAVELAQTAQSARMSATDLVNSSRQLASQQKNLADELLFKERAANSLLDAILDAAAIFDSDRKLMFHNKAFSDMWGLEDAFLLGSPTHGQLLDRLRERRKLPARTDYAAWRADELGYYINIDGVEEDIWSLPDDRTLRVTRQRHPIGGLLVLFKDVTSELDLQTRYNALIKTQSATLDNLHEACVVFGADARLKLHNDAFQRLWELDEEKLEDLPDFDAVVEDCIPLFHDRYIWDAIKGHVTDPSSAARQQTTGEMKRSDGSTLTYLTHPLPDGNTLIAFTDVSATRRVESALRERAEAFGAADRLKTEFVQNVSYQLRSPLATILGYAEFLESQRLGDLSDRQLDSVKGILSAADHLSKLVENILDLAMIEAGRMDLDLADVHLRDLIEDSVEMVLTKAEDAQVTVSANIIGDLGTIRADERRIRQILLNLVSNSLRFTDNGGEVNITASRTGDMIQMSVRDNGRGMDTDEFATSFESFVSGDQHGAGLGLTLVKHFVELHGGTVGMAEVPGGGLEVVTHLPAKQGGHNIVHDESSSPP